MNKEDSLKEGLQLFEKDFQLDSSYMNLEEKGDIRYDEAFLWIMRVVEDLMTKDFSRLINILYRLDVSEQKLKQALAESTDNPASVISKMIIERELQKVETRRKYKG